MRRNSGKKMIDTDRNTGGAFGRTEKYLIFDKDNHVLFSLENLNLQNDDFFAKDNHALFFQLSPDQKNENLKI